MLKAFFYTLLTVLVMDAVWLTLNYKYHKDLIESVQKAVLTVRVVPAVLTYILIAIAVAYFAIKPSKDVKESVKNGALLGLSMYGLYDLTNLATLKGWTIEMLIRDVSWGTFLCAVGAGSGYYLSNKI